MNRRFIVSIVIMTVLTGCSLTSPRDIGNGHRIFLEPLTEKMVCHNRMGSLIVAYPKVPETLDTSQIALVDQTGRWDYFAGMRWADFLPDTVQSTLIQSLSASGKFSTVSSDDTAVLDRLTLGSEINKFEAVYHAGAALPDVEIYITFTLREGGSPRIRKQFIASSTVPAAADNADAIGTAFEQAFTEVQRTALKNLFSCS
jgi:cholesterol transport system auxiliary component